ncbi:MAG: FHA domain-containing protein [Ardenticatenaceae bacterium]
MVEGLFLHILSSDKKLLFEEEIRGGILKKHCNFRLADYFEGSITTISRQHFKVFFNEGGAFIEDLGSSNGTEVNNQRLPPNKPKKLSDGDIIRLAQNDNYRMQVYKILYGTSNTDVISGPERSFAGPIPQRGLYFKEDNKLFYVDGRPINQLPPARFNLLKYLYDNQQTDCSYYQIIKDVWYSNAGEDSVRAAVSYLRKKFEKISPGAGDYIQTVHGYGYKLVTE